MTRALFKIEMPVTLLSLEPLDLVSLSVWTVVCPMKKVHLL